MCAGSITLCKIKNSDLEKILGYEIKKDDDDVSLRVPWKKKKIMLKLRKPVHLIWDVTDSTGKNVDASLRMDMISASYSLKEPEPVTPYAVIGGKEELKGFIERYKQYKDKDSDFVHILTLTYG